MSTEKQNNTEKDLRKVFQGKMMREEASFFSRLFMNYAKPLLESSQTQQIRFEQYGELPDRLKICHEQKLLEEHINHFTKKNPKDKYAFLKGIMTAKKWKFLLFVGVNVLLSFERIFIALQLVSFIDWMQDDATDDYYTTAAAMLTACSIPFSRCITHTIWKYFEFMMIETGHRLHTSLKAMLFAKNLRMTSATNREYDQGQVNSIMMGESNRVWDIIWQMPGYVEAPLILITSLYYCFEYIGSYTWIIVAFSVIKIKMSYVRESANKDLDKEGRKKLDSRMEHINETFQNIKGVKLYGWEGKFLEKIENIYKEEMVIRDKSLIRNKVFDFANGCLEVFMPLLVYGLFYYNGNTTNLSSITMSNLMMSQINDRMCQLNRIFSNFFSMEESMARLNGFYTAPEAQSGLVERSEEVTEDSEFAVTVDGNFSWGINVLDKDQKDELVEQAKKEDEDKEKAA